MQEAKRTNVSMEIRLHVDKQEERQLENQSCQARALQTMGMEMNQKSDLLDPAQTKKQTQNVGFQARQ